MDSGDNAGLLSMSHLTKLWETAAPTLAERIGKPSFDTWLQPLRISVDPENNLILEAPDSFFRDWVEKHYGQLIQETLNSLSNSSVNIHFSTGVFAKEETSIKAPQEFSPASMLPAKEGFALNPRYTFDNFVVGSSNRHAYAYCQAVADAPAKNYNPLFIYGGTGLGKTHLMQAICQHIKKKVGPSSKICYLSSEKFTNELIDAIQHKTTAAFRNKYRNVDVLVIDDVHFLAGREATQEEFFNTFNVLYDAHKQIIISSDRPPKEIPNLQDRLVSRFSWGLTTDVQPPDLETRIAILKKKIEREPVTVPDDVIVFIAGLIKTNIRELEGALIRTIAYSLLEEEPITLDLAKEVLKDLVNEPKKLITVDFIQRCVAEEFGITLPDFKTKKRNKQIVLPRQVAMYLSRDLTDLSLPEIGGHFGGKDHTTVLHSINKIKDVLVKNPELKQKVDRVIQIIKQ